MSDDLSHDRIRAAYDRVRGDLLAERNERGHWTGQLSTSALSTATAVMALVMVRQHSSHNTHQSPHTPLIDGGIAWLAAHQNDDGGWGDTTKSFSNISTTMLCHAVFHATNSVEAHAELVERAKAYIDGAGGVPAVVARYGKDKTFSVPILTHCALAGLVEWGDVTQLPFELACVPPKFYKTVGLPVVSYALPALIAIGQVRHHFRPTRIPGLRWLRNRAKRRSLDVLRRIQPSNGGFLEAAPLTSFVTMSLAGMGLADHSVVRKGVEFLVDSVRDDGSWPIDTNLATWVTTLSVNALGPDLPRDDRERILRWLLNQQFKEVHPFTNADPGGWSWTDLPGGVPDADDTPGAILAILELIGDRPVSREASPSADTEPHPSPSPLPDDLIHEAHNAVRHGVTWLLGIQNRDGGWPTFCRGWGKLPFDRSSADITAHVVRSFAITFRMMKGGQEPSVPILTGELGAWGGNWITPASMPKGLGWSLPKSLGKAFRFLQRKQRSDGSWLPLWFGNQHSPDEINPAYGTAKVLNAYRSCKLDDHPSSPQGIGWLTETQNADGGWGGDIGCPSSVEETALAVEVLLSDSGESSQTAARRGLLWLIGRVEDGTYREPTPIGFYFAKLWYFERLYPLIFTVAALRRACEVMAEDETRP